MLAKRVLLRIFLRAAIACLALGTSSLFAGVDVVDFSDESLRPRYQQLVEELRCPKCQNQNLADSNSAISQDLRRQVQQLLEKGLSDDEIKAYLTSRYSDFILYRPDVNKNTWALWGAPVVLLLLGLFLLRRMSSKTSQPIVPTVTSNERDQERLRKLLGDDKGDVQQ